MKSILVPTDFSDCAQVAATMAIKLAEINKSKIHFLHVINSGIDWINLPKEMESNHPDVLAEIGEAEAKLSELINKAHKSGIEASKSIAHNQSAEDIGAHVLDDQFDFLIMGSYGAKGVKKVIGSNTQKVLQVARVPSLIIKKNIDIEHLSRIIFASNFELIHKRSVELLALVGESLKLTPELLYVNTPDEFVPTDIINERFRKWQNEFRLDCKATAIDAMTIEDGISKFCRSEDLVMLEYHKRSAIRRFFDPSITESIINYTQESVLCVPVDE